MNTERRVESGGKTLTTDCFPILSVVRNYWFITNRHSGRGSRIQ